MAVRCGQWILSNSQLCTSCKEWTPSVSRHSEGSHTLVPPRFCLPLPRSPTLRRRIPVSGSTVSDSLSDGVRPSSALQRDLSARGATGALLALLAPSTAANLTRRPRCALALIGAGALAVRLILVVTLAGPGQAADRPRPGRAHLLALRVLASRRDRRVLRLPRCRLRLPGLRRNRGGGHTHGVDTGSEAGHSVRHPGHGRLRLRILRPRHRRRGLGIRHRSGGPEGIRLVGAAARRPEQPVRGGLGR